VLPAEKEAGRKTPLGLSIGSGSKERKFDWKAPHLTSLLSMSAARMPKSVKALMFVASMALALSAVSGFQAVPLLGSGARTHSAFCPSASKARFSIQSFQAGRGIGGRRRTSGNGVTGLRAEADYYADLGCSRSADQDEIKKAFRQKARKLHPDVNKSPDAIKEFQQIQQAYEVLSDPQKKGLYDQFGEAGVKGGGFGGGGGAGFSDFGDFSPFGDIFDSFFGGGGGGGGRARKPQGPQQGDDLRLDLEIDFTKAIFGGDEKIKISHLETCDTCEVRPSPPPPSCSRPLSLIELTRSECLDASILYTSITCQPQAPPPAAMPVDASCMPALGRPDLESSIHPEWERDEARDQAADLRDLRRLWDRNAGRAHPPRDAAAAERLSTVPGHRADSRRILRLLLWARKAAKVKAAHDHHPTWCGLGQPPAY
jgi:hypothetical protein